MGRRVWEALQEVAIATALAAICVLVFAALYYRLGGG